MPPPGFVAARKAILLGDSHAEMYAPELAGHFYRRHGQQLVHGFRAGCKPFLDLDRHSPGHKAQGCPQSVNPAIERALTDPEIETVVVVAALTSFSHQIYPAFTGAPSDDPERNYRIVGKAMDETFARLVASGKRIVVFLTTPRLEVDPVACQRRPFRWRSSALPDCSLTAEAYDQQQRWSRERLLELARRYPQVTLFDPATALCAGKRCADRLNGKLLYADPSHLNGLGAEYVAARFDF